MRFDIVPAEKAAALRGAFIRRFIDTTSDYFQQHIAALTPDADGPCYDGYLWDCLRDNENWKQECRMEDAAAYLAGRKQVLFMWDWFSQKRLSGKRFSAEHPKGTVIRMDGGLLSQKLPEEWGREQAAWTSGFQCQGLWFPEDVYCFDETMSWYVVFTHETWDSLTDPELGGEESVKVCFLHGKTGQ